MSEIYSEADLAAQSSRIVQRLRPHSSVESTIFFWQILHLKHILAFKSQQFLDASPSGESSVPLRILQFQWPA